MLTALAVGFALARSPLAPPPGPDDKPRPPVEFTEVEVIWRAERLRWCGLIDVGLAPQRAGQTVDTRVRLHTAGGGTEWLFFGPDGKLTLGQLSSSCLSAVRWNRDPGNYAFQFTLPTEAVAHVGEVDGRSSADPAFTACGASVPARTQAVQVATVVDTDGTVWTSEGTRNKADVRTCLGEAHNAWVKGQVAAGTLGVTAPAVIVGTLPAGG